ncbi:MAG: hypothetical protein H6806_07310 [Planctomycetes bacterium]|nr:hypothetical protein [Planctomycetota bacterium]
MADVGRKFRALATDLDCAVLLLHHARKSGGEVGLGMLGTAAIRASSDVNILVERLEKHSTGVSLTFERRDPLRLIALAAGRETGRNPRQQFELVLTTTRGPSGDEVEYVQFRPMSRPAADAGSPPAIDTSKIDTELLQTAMQNLAAGQESSDGPPVVSTSQIREEAGRIISAGQSELPDGYAAPGETRIRAAKNALVNSGTWEKLPGNRGFRLAASKAPTPQASSYIPGLARLAAPSLDAGSGE